MKILHLSDLHLGKKLNGFPLIDDQKYILDQILNITENENPDAVIIAGDIYDKSVPPAQAVNLFDEFLFRLSEKNIKVFAISGNHDSPDRISFGSRIMKNSGIYFSPAYNGTLSHIQLDDRYGKLNFYMLPFIRPSSVKNFFQDTEIKSYTDAVNKTIDSTEIDFNQRNILIAHQFVTGAETCDSEEFSVGGLENVDPSAFDGFDYVALGHIHKPQNVIENRIRYCGTPLKYSFSEVNHKKSVTVIEICEKENIKVRTVPLAPLHEMREIHGTFEEIYQSEKSTDYVKIVLTDEIPVPDSLNKLRTVFGNLMVLEYDNKRTRLQTGLKAVSHNTQSPAEIFNNFYEDRNGEFMNSEQYEYISRLITEIWEGEK